MTPPDSEAIATMRRALQRTWYPFFARFPRPTAVQLAAWRPLLAGGDALVCSPTASGKTEAVLAPLVERHVPSPKRTLPRILVVCPTRALVNDFQRRVEAPLGALGLRAHRRTGDHAVLDKKNPPQVLITTPESFDSLLVRHTVFLRAVRAVVLDELHILDGTPRGDQLRVLLARLRRLCASRKGEPAGGRRLQAIASSATMHTPAALAARYLHAAEPIVVEGRREIATEWVHCPTPAGVIAALRQRYGTEGARKILVFADRRADVEDLASRASRTNHLGGRVYAHHGSLAKVERERVESRFLGDPSAICFATPTLELGIDVGDVDLVGLVGPPGSVSSFLQRVGRGNRRTDIARVLGCYRDAGELARLRHLASLARAGDLCPPAYVFRPSVLVQQVGSLLLQSRQGWISPRVVHERLPQGLGERYPLTKIEELFATLQRGEWLAPGRMGRSHVGTRLAEAFERRTLHANLPREPRSLEVVDETTGRAIASVLKGGAERMAIGGRDRRVVRESEGRIYVAAGDDPSSDGLFAPRGQPTMSRTLARSLARFVGVPEGTLPWVETDDGFALFHFAGSLGGALLAHHLRAKHEWPIRRDTALALHLRIPPEAGPPPAIDADSLLVGGRAIARRLATLAAAGPYHARLPRAWQSAFVREAVPAARIAASWTTSTISRPTDLQVTETLSALARPRTAPVS